MGTGGSRSKSRYYLTIQDSINECDRDNWITHMNILVTGATSGIGLETGRALACAGANVYLTSRYKDKQVTAYSLHAGVIKTSLDLKIPLSTFLKTFLKTKTSAQGAATTVYCVVKSGLEKESDRYFVDSTVTNIAHKWTNEDLNIFWEWTETIIRQRTTHL